MRSEIQAELAAALSDDLADVARLFSAERIKRIANKVTGKTESVVTNQYGGRAVYPLAFKIDEIEALNILNTDAKAIVLQNECSAVPAVADEILIAGVKLVIVHIAQDPAGAIWVLQLRKV